MQRRQQRGILDGRHGEKRIGDKEMAGSLQASCSTGMLFDNEKQKCPIDVRNESGIAIILTEKEASHCRRGFVLIIQQARATTKRNLPWYATPHFFVVQ